MMRFFILFIFLVISSQAIAQSGIPLQTNFDVQVALPIDSRQSMPTLSDRDNIASGIRWKGMIVYVNEDDKHWALIGGTTNAFWTEIGGGSGKGIGEFEPEKAYDQYSVILVPEEFKLYYALEDFVSLEDFDPADWQEISPLPADPVFDSVTVGDIVIGSNEITGVENLESENIYSSIWSPLHIPIIDSSGKIVTIPNFEINVTNDIKIPERLFLSGGNGYVIGGGTLKNRIEHFEDIDFLTGGQLTYTTATRAKSVIGSNNYDIENFVKYPNFLEGSTDQYTCIACTPSIVVGSGVVAGTNSLKITHATTSQLTFEAPTSGQLGQYVTLTMSVKTDTITHIVPVSDTVGDITNQWIISPSPNYQTVTITYPMGATSTGFFVIPQDGGETEISQVHLKRAEDNSRSVVLSTDPVPCIFPTLAWGGLGTMTENSLECQRIGDKLYVTGVIRSGTVSASSAQMPMPINWGSITNHVPSGTSLGKQYGTYIHSTSSPNKGGFLVNGTDATNIRFGANTAFSSSTVNAYAPAVGSSVSGTDQYLIFNMVLTIAEWQTGATVTRLDCAIGDLRCENEITFTYDGTTIRDQFLNSYSFTRSGTSNSEKNISLTDLNLTRPLDCVSSGRTNASTSIAYYKSVSTNTTATITTASGANVFSDLGFTTTCYKTGGDIYYGPNDVLSCENVISANEVKCGRDDINNKPVYRRTLQTTSAVSNATVVVANIGTNLQLKNFVPYGTNTWQYAYYDSAAVNTYYYIYYNGGNGNITIQVGSAMTVRADLQIPLIYTKP